MPVRRALFHRASGRAALAAIGVAAACAGAPEPAPSSPAPPPASASLAPPNARAAPTASGVAAAAPAPVVTSAPALEPPCMPDDLRKSGRVMMAERSDGERLAYCVQRGLGPEAKGRCFTLDPDTSTFHARPTQTFFTAAVNLGVPSLPENPAGATEASAGGTLTVCADAKACISLRLRPAKTDAMDEVFGSYPAWAPPGTSRVIVAHTKEGPFPKDGPPPGTLWLDVYDLKQKRKVTSAVVRKDTYAIDLLPIGPRALLLTCSRKDEGGCGMFVVDPKGPSAKALPIELHPDLPRGSAPTAVDLMPLEGGGWAVLDVRGKSLVALSAAGDVARTVALPSESDLSLGPARAGPFSRGRVVVLQSGPAAGAVHVIDPRDGSVKTHAPPACPAPP